MNISIDLSEMYTDRFCVTGNCAQVIINPSKYDVTWGA